MLINLSNAFDCVPHDLIIAKLHSYGLDHDSLRLIRSYLPNHLKLTRFLVHGCRRLIKIMFESRLVALCQHLMHSKNRSEVIYYIHESERDNILRLANDLINSQNIDDNENDNP